MCNISKEAIKRFQMFIWWLGFGPKILFISESRGLLYLARPKDYYRDATEYSDPNPDPLGFHRRNGITPTVKLAFAFRRDSPEFLVVASKCILIRTQFRARQTNGIDNIHSAHAYLLGYLWDGRYVPIDQIPTAKIGPWSPPPLKIVRQ